MNLKEQLYVCTLAKCQTISKAAEELFISQPALSVYISSLEKTLGVKLFIRTGKCFLLTAIGEEYVQRAQKMLKLKKEFDALVRLATEGISAKIKVGIQMRRAIATVPPVVECFSKEFPHVELIFKEGIHEDLLKMYMDNSVDLLILIRQNDLPDAEYTPIGEEPVLISLPSSHEANKYAYEVSGDHFKHIDPLHLDGETFILPTKGQSLRTSANEIFNDCGIKPGRIIEIRNFETIMAMVETGAGVAFNRQGYLKSTNRFSQVNHYLVGKNFYSSSLVLVHKKNFEFTPHASRLVDLLKEYSYI